MDVDTNLLEGNEGAKATRAVGATDGQSLKETDGQPLSEGEGKETAVAASTEGNEREDQIVT